MSLRAFHLFFIALSVILAAFTAAWAGGQFNTTHQTVFLVSAGGSLAAACGLGFYAASFLRKTRGLTR
jgi:hypothetical protein